MSNLEYLFQHLDKPKWFEYNYSSYVTVMGSHAFGTNNENSDFDYYGFIVAPVELTFPHT